MRELRADRMLGEALGATSSAGTGDVGASAGKWLMSAKQRNHSRAHPGDKMTVAFFEVVPFDRNSTCLGP